MNYYNIFKTKWGRFAIVWNNDGITATRLPAWPDEKNTNFSDKETIKSDILKTCPTAKFDKSGQPSLTEKIQAYYEGARIDFSTIEISQRGTEFEQAVIAALQKIGYGQTTSYLQLAKLANHPTAARATGSVMANNKIPLIVPCHRVIRTDGKLGNFSAPGGITTKQKMLKLESSLSFRTK